MQGCPVAHKYVAACMEAHVCILFHFVPVHNGSVLACVDCYLLLGLPSVFHNGQYPSFCLYTSNVDAHVQYAVKGLHECDCLRLIPNTWKRISETRPQEMSSANSVLFKGTMDTANVTVLLLSWPTLSVILSCYTATYPFCFSSG